MTRRNASAVILWTLTVTLGRTPDARAQAAGPLQFGIGYQFIHQSVRGDGETFPIGIYADLERVMHADRMKSWSWMGQFEAAFRSDSGFSEQLYTALGGIRLSSAIQHRWVPSGFGLLGVGTANVSCDTFCVGSDSGFALQGGFVMTTQLSKSTLLDIAFKATKVKVDGGTFDAAVAGGVRIKLGK